MTQQRTVWLLGLAFAVALYGCGDSGGRPQAGDTVSPVVGKNLTWTAGSAVELSVRLEATGKDGTKRALGFNGIHKDPVANVQFFAGESPLGAQQVSLNHRC